MRYFPRHLELCLFMVLGCLYYIYFIGYSVAVIVAAAAVGASNDTISFYCACRQTICSCLEYIHHFVGNYIWLYLDLDFYINNVLFRYLISGKSLL